MTFEKYNANPENKNIGDCSIRAICTATPLTYQQAKKLLETKVFESGAAWNTVKNITAALADLGIEVKAASRETVNSFTKHCDTGASYVVFVAKHAVAVVNGVIYDTWDSSRGTAPRVMLALMPRTRGTNHPGAHRRGPGKSFCRRVFRGRSAERRGARRLPLLYRLH
jgi:hypothetical protein